MLKVASFALLRLKMIEKLNNFNKCLKIINNFFHKKRIFANNIERYICKTLCSNKTFSNFLNSKVFDTKTKKSKC